MIRRGRRDGTFGDAFNYNALAFALLGVAEGLLRERLIATRSASEAPFSEEEMRKVFGAVLAGLTAAKI